MDAVSLATVADLLGCKRPDNAEKIQVTGVALSHSRVTSGDVFVASAGAKHHGIEFAESAIRAGAVAVVTDQLGEGIEVPQLLVEDPRSLVGLLSNSIYGPIRSRLWAVTGTNGKTSTVTYLYRLLQLLGRKVAVSGSTGFLPSSLNPSEGLTTPEADVLHRQIRDWESLGFSDVVLEVSAQALTRHRVSGLHFAVSGFTNLSHDHLDEYGDMQTYASAKARLFTPGFSDFAVIATGDEYGKEMFASCQIAKLPLVFESAADAAEGYELTDYPGFELRKFGDQLLSTDLNPGPLMARNLALAVAMLVEGGYNASEIESVLPSLEIQVPGRLQKVEYQNSLAPAVFLDYAHTPDAIRSAIGELRRRGFVKVSLVFSASGDRDHSKRPEMARAASLADYVVVTDFHPRSESPAEIRAELGVVLSDLGTKFDDVADPTNAIRQAIIVAEPSAAVLWCGPGHLKYREVGGKKLPFDPEAAIRAALEERT